MEKENNRHLETQSPSEDNGERLMSEAVLDDDLELESGVDIDKLPI